ncbi:MAG: N-6 DNA methylase [Candidatus Hydrogenedentes bacterium]|nr:N-6 DNA methylase [Candidatus Hydrogenedentota bacterium]
MREFMWTRKETHLAHIHNYIECLHWPDDGTSQKDWREQWRSAFVGSKRKAIRDSKELAQEMAHFARDVRKRVGEVLDITRKRQFEPLQQLYKAFKTLLIHDLSEDDFADTYAQTLAYGLFAARAAHPNESFDVAHAPERIPPTNPFLQGLFAQCLGLTKVGGGKIDIEEIGVGRLVELFEGLRPEDTTRILNEFGSQTGDPVIHFYEEFLTEYDKRKKVQRGVFYTPKPVVSYIVRSVHELLQTEFGLEDGLASTDTWADMAARFPKLKIPDEVNSKSAFVQILDPATGTATFLVEVIEVIHRTLTERWKREKVSAQQQQVLWNQYVVKHLLPRLHGYELMMAPYTIAHMKIGLKLRELNFTALQSLGANDRVRVYLTNALEEPDDASGQAQIEQCTPALAREATEVGKIKRGTVFTVVIGNPPYSGISANLSTAMRRSVDPYRFVDGDPIREKSALQFEKNLNDDYVKFFRFAEKQIEKRVGLIGLITNNGYLESATLRGMRNHLLQSFGRRWFLDLHGDADKRERDELDQTDENVFEIKRGVCIALLVRRPKIHLADNELFRQDIRGSSGHKYHWLTTNSILSTRFSAFAAREPNYYFFARNAETEAEYNQAIPMVELYGINSTGFESGRDEILTDFTAMELRSKLVHFATSPKDEIVQRYSVSEAWGKKLFDERATIVAEKDFARHITPFLFGPFDLRYCFYRKDLLKTNSHSAGKHLLAGQNVALMVMRQVSIDGPFTHIGVSKVIPNNRCFYSTKGKISYFPHELLAGDRDLPYSRDRFVGSNFRPQALARIKRLLKPHQSETELSDRAVFDYAYAVFHSPGYRSRYAEFLKTDFPRLPLTGNLELFGALARLGGELVALHLLESPKLDKPITEFIGGRNPEVEKVSWSNNTVWVDKAQTTGFQGVREDVWNFHVGGYQVCEKWLKDRRGRTLSDDDIAHYHKIVVALTETIRIMKEIDEVIDQHGGWPGAFLTGNSAATVPPEASETVDLTSANNEPESPCAAADEPDLFSSVESVGSDELEGAAEELPEVQDEDDAPSYRPISEVPREEVLCAVRKILTAESPLDRDDLLKRLAEEFGYQRLGPKARDLLEDDLKTAVRRGIAKRNSNEYSLIARGINGYNRNWLKDCFVSATGRTWISREDAIRQFARHLGFARTGSAIEDMARSLIKGLLREGRLESDGPNIRRV